MPVVTVTLIEGYAAAAKARLVRALGLAVRATLDAPPEGITVFAHEVKAGDYARGLAPRSPAPPPPDAVEVVETYLAAMERRDLAAASAFLAAGAELVFPGGARFTRLEDLVAWSAGRYQRVGKRFDRFDAAPAEDGVVVTVTGTLYGVWPDGSAFEGIRFVDVFRLVAGAIVLQEVWNDLALHAPS
ncbi:DUF4440 domain-containing protein [Acuticoccus mangrovi]|uniref:DUF4440 domain-containing protein n=1 Tax=Acuticoccus mangrovi TaxID=2796142 RepID=A0A934IW83_9HYPH|nr:DUF4440 domain-containing protein [Acuticoccus mangrovi]MBJ3778884.1 DUF4440 domain-containing protein [Acuticoccus mangrovi]